LIEENYTKDTLHEYPISEGMDELDWLMRHDINFYLPDCLMVKMDIASMANSLEVRSPFLDYEFVEFAASIPSHLKRKGQNGKIILKNAVKELLPKEIMEKHKTGFGSPIASWFRNELSNILKETLLSEKAQKRGLFNFEFIKKMIDEHTAGKKDWSGRLWAFLFLELWFIEFID
jgi:asparagine synthase (glutamine-hydrolysing)